MTGATVGIVIGCTAMAEVPTIVIAVITGAVAMAVVVPETLQVPLAGTLTVRVIPAIVSSRTVPPGNGGVSVVCHPSHRQWSVPGA